MCAALRRVAVLVTASLFLFAPSCCGFVKISLANADISTFASGTASGWNAFTTGNAIPSLLQFYADSTNFQSAPYSQGISGIDTSGPPGGMWGCGIMTQIPASPGKVYLLSGFQDLYDPWFDPPPARRYAHLYGIDPYGQNAPPQPFTTGSLKWMKPGQWYFNDVPGNSTQLGGMHRCLAAFSAKYSSISLWTGVFVLADTPCSVYPTVFNADEHSLYEFDNSARDVIDNPGLEIIDNLTPELGKDDLYRITLPRSWVPTGGGIGQFESYYTDNRAMHSGAAGLRIYNRRGCFTRGVMQRVKVPPQTWRVAFSAWVRGNTSAGTIAKVGIDPTGGDDINSPSVIWSYYTASDESWRQISTSITAPGPVVTLFLGANNGDESLGLICYADFDDTAVSFTPDLTAPSGFNVTTDSSTTLLHYLTASISSAPADPESGITSVDYAVGTSPNGEDIRSFTDCSGSMSIQAAGINLTPGAACYITVRATNGVGISTTAISQPILCQPQPYAYTWSGPIHLSQTSFNADNPRISAYGDKIYAAWRESDDPSWNGVNSRVMYCESNTAKWSSPTAVNAFPGAWWPDVSASIWGVAVSCITPGNVLGNDLHIALKRADGSFKDYPVTQYVSSFPRLQSTSSGLVVGCNQDPVGNPTTGDPALILQKQPGWSLERIPVNAHPCSDCRTRIFSCGARVHCLWGQAGSGSPSLYYCSRDSLGNYSVPQLIARGAKSGEIAVSASGEVSIVYPLNGGIWYTRSTDRTTFDAPQYLGAGQFAYIAAGPDNRVHVLLYEDTAQVNENGVAMVHPIHLVKDASGWSMPCAIAAASCTSGVWAQEPGNVVVDEKGQLHVVWSHNQHDPGWQSGGFGGYCWVDYFTTAPVQNNTNSIANAKLWGDDIAAQAGYAQSKVVELRGKQVTAIGTFGVQVQSVYRSVPCFYIEENDRSSGIRVIAGDAEDSPAPTIAAAVGDTVDVSGVISTIGSERSLGYITSTGKCGGVTFTRTGRASDPISPLFMNIRSLGGGPTGPTPGAAGGTGLNNIGILVKVAGRVISDGVDERNVHFVYVDDGSGICRVYDPGNNAEPGNFIVVTGVSKLEASDPATAFTGGAAYMRSVMPRDNSSVEVIAY